MLRRAIFHNQRWGRELCAYFSCLRPTEPVRPGQMVTVRPIIEINATWELEF